MKTKTIVFPVKTTTQEKERAALREYLAGLLALFDEAARLNMSQAQKNLKNAQSVAKRLSQVEQQPEPPMK